MFEIMFEVRKDNELDKFIIAPMGQQNEDYIIICETEYDAKSLCAQISMQLIPDPSKMPMKYKSLGTHPNGKTLLYQLKA